MAGRHDARESGSRREYRKRAADPRGRLRRRSQAERCRQALVDVAVYRAVAWQDLKQTRFDGHPYAAKRGIERLRREGHVELVRAVGPRGGSFTVVVATERGAALARRELACKGRRERTWHGAVKHRELAHDCAVYREASKVISECRASGRTVVRLRSEADLKSTLARASETARKLGGRKAADKARLEAARALHLPIRDGSVAIPDLRVELLEPDGLTAGRVDIEIVSGSYKSGQIAAKAAAGFRLAASGGAALRRMAAVTGGSDIGGRAKGRPNDPGLEL